MSWQSYVDNNMVGTGNCTQALIVGHDGSIWAKSAGVCLQGTEGTLLVKGFTDNATLFSVGLCIAGSRYLVVRADQRTILGRKGATGVVAVKTTQAVLVGLYDETIQAGNCSKTVEVLADYLIENGY